jgi:preprotein translocase subunit SecD
MSGTISHLRTALRLSTVLAGPFLVASPPVAAEEPRPVVEIEFRLASETAVDGWESKPTPEGSAPVYLAPDAVIANADIERAWYEPMQGKHGVGILLTEDAGLRLARFSSRHIGERMAIVVDGRVVSTPRIMAEISGGRALVHGGFDEAEARAIADKLMSER